MAITRLMTVEELEREGAPEGRWELIDGKLVEMPPASDEHGQIGSGCVGRQWNHVVPRRLGNVYGADTGFVLFPGQELARVPDAAFVHADRLRPDRNRAGFLRLAPDLVVEVISPSNRRPDVLAKVQLWLDAGVRLLWLADPVARTVSVYGPDRAPRVLTEADELDGGEVLPEFRLPLSAVFA